MAINKTFSRAKANTTLPVVVDLSATIAETASGWVVDIYSLVEKDDATTANKTLFRIVIPATVSGSNLRIAETVYAFPGNAANYSAGGASPPLSSAVEAESINLDEFYVQAGNARKNT